MLVENTPLEDHREAFGLLVKREDLSCPPPGPPFSKTRGVLRHVQARYAEGVRKFGVLDTFHSQAGHAVAMACRVVGAECVNYFPVYKTERKPWTHENHEQGKMYLGLEGDQMMEVRGPQRKAVELGAQLVSLQAGRSAVLYHTAKRITEEKGGYMMPNALKLPETVEETAREVIRTFEHADRHRYKELCDMPWLISASSGTIAAGVIRGLLVMRTEAPPPVIIHMGYERPEGATRDYISKKSGKNINELDATFIQEGYAYKDVAKPGETPPWACNNWYDLKAFRWWMAEGRARYGQALMWNIG